VCRTQRKSKFKSVSQNSEFIVYFNRRGRVNDKGQHTWIAANGIDPLQYLAHSATAACYQFLLSLPSSLVDCCLFKSSFLFCYCGHCSPPLVRPLLLLSPPHCAMVFQNKTTVPTDCCCCCHCCQLIVALFFCLLLWLLPFRLSTATAWRLPSLCPLCYSVADATLLLLLWLTSPLSPAMADCCFFLHLLLICHWHPLPMLPPLVFAVVILARSLYHGIEMPLQCRLLLLLQSFASSWLLLACFSKNFTAPVIADLPSCRSLHLFLLLLFLPSPQSAPVACSFLEVCHFSCCAVVDAAAAALAVDDFSTPLTTVFPFPKSFRLLLAVSNGHWHRLIVASF